MSEEVQIVVRDQKCDIMQTPCEPQLIESIARVCYQSEPKRKPGEDFTFLKNLARMGHLSVFEHAMITLDITTNRGITHELVRHRLCSFSQESTRYVNYGKNPIEFILPARYRELGCKTGEYSIECKIIHFVKRNKVEVSRIENASFMNWVVNRAETARAYSGRIENGYTPQEAREELDNCIKSQIIISTNMRNMRHVLNLRLREKTGKVHPDMKVLMDEVSCILRAHLHPFWVWFLMTDEITGE